ncbi:MAG TPA: hypothetical protein VL485_02770 [Ktedonobacteraceae bacterium]|nr:hypothetical protein [Ktedonobacteraceae bacterium]
MSVIFSHRQGDGLPTIRSVVRLSATVPPNEPSSGHGIVGFATVADKRTTLRDWGRFLRPALPVDAKK